MLGTARMRGAMRFAGAPAALGGVRWNRSEEVRRKVKGMVREEFRDLIDSKELGTAATTSGFMTFENAPKFPRIKTTSLSTKRIVVQDEAKKADATLLQVCFRMSGADQIKGWMTGYEKSLNEPGVQTISMMVNETFLFRALSGFIQSSQRRKVPQEQHDKHIVYNNKGDSILRLVNNDSRVLGYLLLLDKTARVRWFGYGKATDEKIDELIEATGRLIIEAKTRNTKT